MQMSTTEGWPYFMRKCLHEMPPETTTRKTTTTQSDEAAQHNGIHSGHYNASGADAGPHLWNVRSFVCSSAAASLGHSFSAQKHKQQKPNVAVSNESVGPFLSQWMASRTHPHCVGHDLY